MKVYRSDGVLKVDTAVGIVTGAQPIAISAGTQSQSTGTILFSNSNGISFGMSNSSKITASFTRNVAGNAIQSVGSATGSGTATSQFAAHDHVHAGVFSMGVTNSGNTQGNTRVDVGRFVLIGTNNITLSQATAAGGLNSIYISGGAGGGGGNFSAGVSTGGNTAGSTGVTGTRLVLVGTNMVSLSQSTDANGGTVTWNATQSNQSLGIYASSHTFGQSSSSTYDGRSLSIVGSGNISVGWSNSSLLISAPTGGNFSAGLSIYGNTAGNTGVTGTQLVLAAYSALTLSQITDTAGATIQIFPAIVSDGIKSVGSATGSGTNTSRWAADDHVHAGVFSAGVSNDAGNTAGNTRVDVGQFVLRGGQNITLSQITAAGALNTVVVSNAPPLVSYMSAPPSGAYQTNFTISNATFSLQHFSPAERLSVSRVNLLMSLSGNTNSSGALTVSLGIYTMTGSTLSLASSDSRQISWTSGSQTSASSLYGGQSGVRYRTISVNNWAVTEGDYMLGIWFRTTNDGTWRAYGAQGPTIVGALDAAETNHYLPGHSTSSFTTAMPASINVTDTNWVRSGGSALQQPSWVLMGSY